MKVHTREVVEAIESAASRKMLEAVNAVRNQVLETLSGPRRGRFYYVPGTRRPYQASAEGEAPATATAELRQSIETSIETEGKTVIGMVGTDKKQGKWTEVGTVHMKKRPWLRVSFEKAEQTIKDIFDSRWF